MNFLPLKIKSKDFRFTSFGNDEAVVVFSRFPMPDEFYPVGDKVSILGKKEFKNFDNTEKGRAELAQLAINNVLENMLAGKTDYKKFFKECVDRIDDLQYEGKPVITVNDFFQILPED